MVIESTKGQVQDALSKAATKFYLQTLGVGPKETKVYIVNDMVIVRFKGRLLPMEQKLLESTNGIALVKDIRQLIHETMITGMSEIIKQITGDDVISSHSDVSTKTGEIVQIYIINVDLEEKFTNKKS